MKRILLSLTVILLIAAVISIGAVASAQEYSGNCSVSSNDNVHWSFDSATGVLKITGTGEMVGRTTVSDVHWENYKNQITSIVIENGVTSIGNYAFSDCAIKTITLPDSIKKIGNDAFRGCGELESITLGNGVTHIGSSAFYDCYTLASIKIPESVTYIGGGAFHNTKVYNDRANWIDKKIFCIDNCFIQAIGLKGDYTVSDNVRLIADSAFSRCTELASVTIGDNVTAIGDNAFHNCKALTGIKVSQNNKFYCSDSRGVLFNKDKTRLMQYPFGNKADKYTVPASVKEVVYYSFYGFFSRNDLTLYVVAGSPAEAYAKKNRIPFEEAPTPGSIVNQYLHTDIKATIDGKVIRSYNIDGNTAIVAEDLASYGFNVAWNGTERSLTISEGNKIVTGGFEASGASGTVGTPAGNVLYTDIITYVNGKQVTSYNIGGMTAIILDDLAAFGKVGWDGTTRTISFAR